MSQAGSLQTPASSTQDPKSLSSETPPLSAVDNTQNPVDLQDVHTFFSDDDGRSFISSSDGSESLGPPRSPLSRISTRLSVATVATAVPPLGVLDLSLSDLCKHIADHRSLQEAEIVSTECYAQNLGGVTHRFLVLELRRANRKDVWLRLDRRRGENVSLVRFLAFSGVTKANDRALISSGKGPLVGQARAENLQVFNIRPSLDELRVLLAIICEEIVLYRIWPENCWFFCSLIQQHLEGTQSGWFENGSLKYASLAQRIRLSVATRFWTKKTAARQAVMSPPHPPLPSPSREASREVVFKFDPQFLRTLQMLAFKESYSSDIRSAASNVQEQIDQMEILRSVTVSVNGPCKEVIRRLEELHLKCCDARRSAEAVVALREAVALQKYLCAQDPSEDGIPLIRLMFLLSRDLYESQCSVDSCALDEEVIPMIQRLCDNDPDQDRANLAMAMAEYGIHLNAMGRFEESCASNEASIKIWRELYALNRDAFRDKLATNLRNHGLILGRLGRYGEGAPVIAEAISLRREGLKVDLEGPKRNLAQLLHEYAYMLHFLELPKQAYDASKECVVLFKHEYEQNPAQHRDSLIGVMSNHVIASRSVGCIEEADAIREEIEKLKVS